MQSKAADEDGLGKRVVVTRSVAQAPILAEQLKGAGLQPIVFPVIKFNALPVTLRQPAAYDWIVFTSVNGVEFFFNYHIPKQLIGQVAVAAVGSATVHALGEKGVAADVVPEKFSGDHLVRALEEIEGQHILLPRSHQGRPDIVALLQDRGAIVDELPLYDTVLNSPSREQWRELAAGWDIVTFTSPSSIRSFIEIIGRPPPAWSHISFLERLKNQKIVCIGPVTRQQALDLGYEVEKVPDNYTIADLVDVVRGVKS